MNAAARTQRPSTVADYYGVPEGGPRYQLICGEMIRMAPAPNRLHQKISRNLMVQLWRHLEDGQRGEVYDAPLDVELSEIDVFQPDLAVVLSEHVSILTEQGMRGAPDLVVEILSPGTARYDLGAKREVYARCGVQELWIIDPDARRLSVYRFPADAARPVATYGERDSVETPLLPGLRVDLGYVFNAGL